MSEGALLHRCVATGAALPPLAAAAVEYTDIYGRNALHVAALNSRPDAAAALVAAGCSPVELDTRGKMPKDYTGPSPAGMLVYLILNCAEAAQPYAAVSAV